MNDSKTAPTAWHRKNKRNTLRLGLWTAAWVATMAVANFGPKFLWQSNEIITVLAIAINLMIGLGMIWANKNHLQGLDEMQQRIHFEAMAITLGIGLVVGLSYSNLDIANIIAFDAEISHLVILMGLTYLGAIIFGNWRYR